MDTKTLIFSFTAAIQNKNIVLVRFQSKADNQVLLRKCAPLDIAPSRRTKSKVFKFHLWDYNNQHNLSLEISQILDVKITAERFTPEEVINWNHTKYSWFVVRDWGAYS